MNLLLLRTHFKSILIVAGFFLILLTTYINNTLKNQHIILKQSQDELLSDFNSAQRTHLWADSLEGERCPDFVVHDAFGVQKKFAELITSRKYTILITEPPNACSTCLEATLQSWRSKPQLPETSKMDLLVVSSGEDRRALQLCLEFGIEKNCYSDANATLYLSLNVPSSSSVAMLVNQQRTVIYVCFLNWKHPEVFRDFLRKVFRFLKSQHEQASS